LRRSRGLVVNNIQFNSVESLTATVWRYEETSPDLQLFMDTTSLSIVDICCLSCCYCIVMWNCNYYL